MATSCIGTVPLPTLCPTPSPVQACFRAQLGVFGHRCRVRNRDLCVDFRAVFGTSRFIPALVEQLYPANGSHPVPLLLVLGTKSRHTRSRRVLKG